MASKALTAKAASVREAGAKWLDRINAAGKREDDWLKAANIAENIYLAEAKDGATKQYFNILHSNVETIVPATYNSTPAPDIRRRFNDRDPVAKAVADILERAITVQIDDGALDCEMEGVSQSAFLAGRGIIRIRLETQDPVSGEKEDEIADEVEDAASDEEGSETDEADEGEVADQPEPAGGYQCLRYEAVAWNDFRMGPAKRWQDVPWVAFRHTISEETIAEWEKDELVAAQMGKALDDEQEKGDVEVWELWDKKAKTIHFIKGTDGLVYRSLPDPLKLTGFFPCPKPAQPIKVVGSTKAVTPYSVYRELAEELEEVTKRIKNIVKGIKVRGGAAAGETLKEISKIAQLGDNEIAEIRGTEAIAQQGGLDKAIIWWPIDKAVAALTALAQHRESIKSQIYEVTGISDIVRGASDSQETARAQEIKTQWGSLRIQKMQKLLERCVRDLFVMSAELISAHFTRDNLQKMTGIAVTPEMEALLTDHVTQYYRINVESESTVKADLSKSRTEMAQFLQGTAQYMQTVGPLVQEGVVPAQIALEIYAAFARTFNLGKSAEDAVEQIGQDLQAQQGQPKPNPEADKAAADAKQSEDKHQQEMRHREESHQQDLAFRADENRFQMAKQGAAEGDPSMGGGFVDKSDAYAMAVMKALENVARIASAPRVSEIQIGPDGQKRAVSTPMLQPQPPQQPMVN